MFDPEAVWQQSGLSVAMACGFLHENVLHFLTDDAIDDAALLAASFSDVGAPLLVAPLAPLLLRLSCSSCLSLYICKYCVVVSVCVWYGPLLCSSLYIVICCFVILVCAFIPSFIHSFIARVSFQR